MCCTDFVPSDHAERKSLSTIFKAVSSLRLALLPKLLACVFIFCGGGSGGRADEGAKRLVGNEGGKLAVLRGALSELTLKGTVGVAAGAAVLARVVVVDREAG